MTVHNISCYNDDMKLEHFIVPPQVYRYIQQLECYIKCPNKSKLKEVYNFRFGDSDAEIPMQSKTFSDFVHELIQAIEIWQEIVPVAELNKLDPEMLDATVKIVRAKNVVKDCLNKGKSE